MLQKIRASVNTHRVQKKSTITTFGRTFESFERLVPSSSFQNKMNSAGHQKKKIFSHTIFYLVYILGVIGYGQTEKRLGKCIEPRVKTSQTNRPKKQIFHILPSFLFCFVFRGKHTHHTSSVHLYHHHYHQNGENFRKNRENIFYLNWTRLK